MNGSSLVNPAGTRPIRVAANEEVPRTDQRVNSFWAADHSGGLLIKTTSPTPWQIGEVLMAKKKAAGGLEGTRIRVKPGVNSPEFPEIGLTGWTGTVVETTGKPPEQKMIIEWDAATLAAMPSEYIAKCESEQLYHMMASLRSDDVEIAT